MHRAPLCFTLAAASFAATAQTARFAQAQKAVEQGDYKPITSILVAQDGNVLYEQYFVQRRFAALSVEAQHATGAPISVSPHSTPIAGRQTSAAWPARQAIP